MKKAISIITVVLLVTAASVFGLIYRYENKTKYNESYVNGNTPGNLYNAGLFCESNGTVFFANPDDKYRLYSMDLDGSNLAKLSDDTVMYINADSHYVYYVRNNEINSTHFNFFSFNNNSLCRIKRNGKQLIVLDPDPCIYASLVGNYIYYLHYDEEHATTLYKVGIDGKERQMVNDSFLFTCSALGQYFYSNGTTTDGCLYRYDSASDSIEQIYECNSYKPIVTGDNDVYYLDVNQNNALVHTNIQFDNPRTLSNDSIDLYNIYGSTIFYQNYSEETPALCMMKNDGSGYTRLAEGTYSNINVTSYYIYFTDFKTQQVFRTPTANPGDIEPFHPGVITD